MGKSKAWGFSPKSLKVIMLLVAPIFIAIFIVAFISGCGGGGGGSSASSVIPSGEFPENPGEPDVGNPAVTCTPSPAWEVQIESVSPATSTPYVTYAANPNGYSVFATYKNAGDIPIGSGLSLLPDNTATPTVAFSAIQTPASVAIGSTGLWETQISLPEGAETFTKCFYLGADTVCAVGSAVCWTFRVQ